MCLLSTTYLLKASLLTSITSQLYQVGRELLSGKTVRELIKVTVMMRKDWAGYIALQAHRIGKN